MKLPMVIVLLVALGDGAEVSISKKKKEINKTEKRALVEGNAGVVERRSSAMVTSTARPGIVYADATESHSEKSPTHQLYSTPAPQLAKISDVLAGQGSSFPTAIASHLFSPVSVYQQKYAAPSPIAISAPIPSQMTIVDPRTYPAPQNAIQFSVQQPVQNGQVLKQNIPNAEFNQAPIHSFIRIYPQQQQQQQQQFAQTVVQGMPQLQLRLLIPSTQNLGLPIYYTNSEGSPQNFVQQSFAYRQGHIIPNYQQGLTYALQEKNQLAENRAIAMQQSQSQPQPAISFASFLQGHPSQPPQHQYNQQHFVPIKLEPASQVTPLAIKPISNPHPQISYFRPGPLLPPLQQSIVQHPHFFSKNVRRSPLHNPPPFSMPHSPPRYHYGRIAQPIFG